METEAVIELAEAPRMRPRDAGRRHAWIVVEDYYEAGLLAQVLADSGWAVDGTFRDPAALNRAIRCATPLPDLLVLALRFEDGDGFRLMREMAAQPSPPAVFIVSHQQRSVIVSALTLAEALGLRVAGSAEQPINAAEMRRALREATLKPRSKDTVDAGGVELSERDVYTLIEAGCIEAWLQPKLRLDTSEIVGVEALIRAVEPSGRVIGSAPLIEGLRACDLLERATLHMLEQAVTFVGRSLQHGMALSASVNVSMASLSDARFCRQLMQILHNAGVDPSWITLEVTEHDAMADAAALIENVARIRMLGFNLAIDDFGTAYSSLTRLAELPFSELKIERRFVTGLADDKRKRAIVDACAALATSLGLQVVAEGVETLDDLLAVRASGCSLAQGYFIAKPMPIAQMSRWLRLLPDLKFDGESAVLTA